MLILMIRIETLVKRLPKMKNGGVLKSMLALSSELTCRARFH